MVNAGMMKPAFQPMVKIFFSMKPLKLGSLQRHQQM